MYVSSVTTTVNQLCMSCKSKFSDRLGSSATPLWGTLNRDHATQLRPQHLRMGFSTHDGISREREEWGERAIRVAAEKNVR